MDFKGTDYIFFESDTLFLECVFVCAVVSCLAILRIEGCLKQYPLTVFLESPRPPAFGTHKWLDFGGMVIISVVSPVVATLTRLTWFQSRVGFGT